MKPDPIQKMLSTDLSAALQGFHLGRDQDRSEAATEWSRLFEVAKLSGYTVEPYWINERTPIAIVVPVRSSDPLLTSEWNRVRKEYYNFRCRVMNNPDSRYIDRWQPGSKDELILKELGVTWTSSTPQSEEPEVPQNPES